MSESGFFGICRKLLYPIIYAGSFVLLIAIISVVCLIPDISDKIIPQPWNTIILIFSMTLINSAILVYGAWKLFNNLQINELKTNVEQFENNIEKIDGIIPKLGIMRERLSLHLLPSETKWVIGAKLDYPEARINNFVNSLEKNKLKFIAFLCIDTEAHDLNSRIGSLQKTIEDKYHDDTDLHKDIVRRIFIRKINADAISMPMDIYDPYKPGKARVAIYFPHSVEFLNTPYDVGFFIDSKESQQNDPTHYFISKAKWLWENSFETYWHRYKQELGVSEDWNKIILGLQEMDKKQKEELSEVIEKSLIDYLSRFTKINNAAIEEFLNQNRQNNL